MSEQPPSRRPKSATPAARPRRAPWALLAAAGAALPSQAAVEVERDTLLARVQAVRIALDGDEARAAQVPAATLVAQAANWTNWPKWSKWSNWANK